MYARAHVPRTEWSADSGGELAIGAVFEGGGCPTQTGMGLGSVGPPAVPDPMRWGRFIHLNIESEMRKKFLEPRLEFWPRRQEEEEEKNIYGTPTVCQTLVRHILLFNFYNFP